MKTIGIRALRENPGVLSKCALNGELVIVTNRNDPISIAVPFSDELLNSGIHINMAVKLYDEGMLTLSKAATLAKMSVEVFIRMLGYQGIVVVDQSSEELDADLDSIDE